MKTFEKSDTSFVFDSGQNGKFLIKEYFIKNLSRTCQGCQEQKQKHFPESKKILTALMF